MNTFQKIVLFAFVALATFSCTCNREQKQAKKETEIDASSVDVKIVRFEKDLFECNPNNMANELAALAKKYPMFYPVFYNSVLVIPAVGDSVLQLEVMKDFVAKPAMKGLYDTVQSKFADLQFLKDDLKICFANYKSYFPKNPIPEIYTCISEFSYSVFTISDSIIGLSLDKYLGANYMYYPSVFEQTSYMIPTFDKKYMAIDVANALASNVIAVPGDKSTLLDKMLTEGKILFFIQSVLPNKKDFDIIKYTEKQYKWCEANELQIWTYFLNQNRLYDTKFEQFKYVKDGPSTYGMPKESPGRAGAWLGWQIIRKYMQENPNTTLKQLIDEKDGQKILTASKYKPKV
ncbi:MAG: hypothetical protein U0U67_03525 [Chitinophagales bacterium]